MALELVLAILQRDPGSIEDFVSSDVFAALGSPRCTEDFSPTRRRTWCKVVDSCVECIERLSRPVILPEQGLLAQLCLYSKWADKLFRDDLRAHLIPVMTTPACRKLLGAH